MLSAFYEKTINSYLSIEPTNDQKELIDRLSKFISGETQADIFIVKGFAGTGKTTIISALVNALNELEIDNILLAPTGRAAKVFSNTAMSPAYTIHKKIFKVVSESDFNSKFVLGQNIYQNAFFIIDEASMISDRTEKDSFFGSGNLLTDLLKYAFSGKNCKIIFAGDTAQLPPVGLSNSPALEIATFYNYNKVALDFKLTQVVRQSLDSGILFNANIIRNHLENNKLFCYPKLNFKGFKDVERINGSELIEKLADTYNISDINNVIVLTRSNQRANKYNEGIRRAILSSDEVISSDDILMIVKNNYFWKDNDHTIDFIANGDMAQIKKISNFQDLYDLKFADVKLHFFDYDLTVSAKIMLDTLWSNSAAMTYDEYKAFFDKVMLDYADIPVVRERYKKIKANKYINSLQIKFAYAITCHKSQGGQWDYVFIDQSYLTEQMLDIDYFRWLYTAFTRAKKKIYLVNFNDEFFED